MVRVEFLLRDAGPGDADELTNLLMRSRARAMPWLASPHDKVSTRWWMQHGLLAEQHVRVADDGCRLLGFAATAGPWLKQLYVDPDHQGRGVGWALLQDAKRRRPDGLRLHVFTRNTPARCFYEAAGFVLVEHSDGHGNEEQEPDCTYAWTPARCGSPPGPPGTRPAPSADSGPPDQVGWRGRGRGQAGGQSRS